jgi:hypothetical protein
MNLNRFLGTALKVLPLLAATGYLMAFLHEAGYAQYYGFPLQFINLTAVLQFMPSILLLTSLVAIAIVEITLLLLVGRWWEKPLAAANLVLVFLLTAVQDNLISGFWTGLSCL